MLQGIAQLFVQLSCNQFNYYLIAHETSLRRILAAEK